MGVMDSGTIVSVRWSFAGKARLDSAYWASPYIATGGFRRDGRPTAADMTVRVSSARKPAQVPSGVARSSL